MTHSEGNFGKYLPSTFTVLYESRGKLDSVVEGLVKAGIDRKNIRAVEGNDPHSKNAVIDHQGFWEKLEDFLFSDQERDRYAEGLRRGNYLITVTDVSPDFSEAVLDILEDGANVEAQSEEWRSQGWTPKYS
jgi:hypothetical protein